VHLCVHSISASQCISKLARSRPPSASLSSLHLGLPVRLQTRSITASKCISEFTPSRPPSASPNSLDHGLPVHVQSLSITDSKYILTERRWEYVDTGVTEVEWATRSIYSGDPGVDRQHLIFISSRHTSKIHNLSFPTFCLTRSVRGSTPLLGSSRPGCIISSHLPPTLLEHNEVGMRGEIFAASPIALTQWTHSDVWSQLATTPDCLFNIGDRQSEKKRRNGDWRAICNATSGIDARRRVIRLRCVSDSSDGAHPLWRSASTLTEPFRPHGDVFCWCTHWDNTKGLGEGPEWGFGCPGLHHASIVVLLHVQVPVHPENHPGCCFCVELYNAVTDTYHCSQLWLEVHLVAMSVCEQCRLHSCSIKLQPAWTHPLNDIGRAFVKLCDDRIDVGCNCHQAKVIHKRESFGPDILLNSLNLSWGVDCAEHQQHWLALWDPCVR